MSVYIIADLHLSPDTPELNNCFFNFCQCLEAGDSLYILGDFFDHFVEPDLQNPLHPILQEHFSAIRKKNIEVFFMHGNRDFLLTKKMAKFFNFTLIKDNVILNLGSNRMLLMHGDELCTAHKGYIFFRFISRCRFLQILFFLFTTRKYRLGLARRLRQNSRRNFERQNCVRENINMNVAIERMHQSKCNILIHGHTHNVSLVQLTGEHLSIYDTGDWRKTGYSYIKLENNSNKPQIITCDATEKASLL